MTPGQTMIAVGLGGLGLGVGLALGAVTARYLRRYWDNGK